MADDASTPIRLLPDENVLTARAKAAGVDVSVLSPRVRRLALLDFRTVEEQAKMDDASQAEREADAREYNEHLQKHGLWNAHIRPW